MCTAVASPSRELPDWQCDLTKASAVCEEAGALQGMRAVVALAQEPSAQERAEAAAANETWVAYPDDSPRRSPFFAGDSRAAMVPLLAHQAGPSLLMFSGIVSCFLSSFGPRCLGLDPAVQSRDFAKVVECNQHQHPAVQIGMDSPQKPGYGTPMLMIWQQGMSVLKEATSGKTWLSVCPARAETIGQRNNDDSTQGSSEFTWATSQT